MHMAEIVADAITTMTQELSAESFSVVNWMKKIGSYEECICFYCMYKFLLSWEFLVFFFFPLG